MQRWRHPVIRGKIIIRPRDAKGAPNRLCGRAAAALIQGYANLGFANSAQVDPFFDRRLHHRVLQQADIHRNGVKKGLRLDFKSGLFQPFGQPNGFAVDALGNGLKPFWAVEYRIE